MNLKLKTLLIVTCVVVPVASQAHAEVTPPADSGCGSSGPTKSAATPTVRLATALSATQTGRVRLRLLDATQTAAVAVRIRQKGGRLVGGNTNHSYTCTTADAHDKTVSVPLNGYGRALLRHRDRLVVTVTLRLINGSGVRNTVSRSAVIRPAA